jgi:hypothetical protein
VISLGSGNVPFDGYQVARVRDRVKGRSARGTPVSTLAAVLDTLIA